MEDNELVSVLMCVYNTPTTYLQQAIDSILGQIYTHLEFIIVDDGSDNLETVECLKNNSLKDCRIKLISNPQNAGLTKALNIGLERCRGKYIARMDADDISLDRRILEQKEYMDTHPEVSLLGCNIIEFGDGIDNVDTAELPDRTRDDEIYKIRSLLEHSGPPHPTFMLRGSFFRTHGIKYREDILKAQDYALMVDCLKADGVIKKLESSLLMYRLHAGQITANAGKQQQHFQEMVSCEYLRYLFEELSGEETAALATLCVDDYCCSNRRYISAVKKIIRLNRQKNLFDHAKFETEFKQEWYRKVMRSAKTFRKVRGLFSFYTIGCAIKTIKER